GAVARRLDRQQLVETDAEVAIAGARDLRGVESERARAAIDDDEVVAGALHFRKAKRHGRGGDAVSSGCASVWRIRTAGAGVAAALRVLLGRLCLSRLRVGRLGIGRSLLLVLGALFRLVRQHQWTLVAAAGDEQGGETGSQEGANDTRHG